MKWLLLAVCSFMLLTAHGQEKDESTQLGFARILGSVEDDDPFLSIAEDRLGFLWFTRQLKGLQRCDGQNLKSFQHDPGDSNSLARFFRTYISGYHSKQAALYEYYPYPSP